MTDTANATVQIDKFDKASCALVRAKVQAALDAVGAELGITLKMGNIGFAADGSSFSTRVEGTVVALAAAAAARTFAMYAETYGLDASKVAKTRQGEIRLVGFDSKKRAKPWLLTVDGKPNYRADTEYVRQHFAKAA